MKKTALCFARSFNGCCLPQIIQSTDSTVDATMKRDKLRKFLSEQLITIATLASVVLGVIFGLVLRNSSSQKWTEREIMYIKFCGEIFLRILKGLTLPLIISSLIAAIGSLNLRLSGRLGVRAIMYYLITTALAVSLGILLVLTIRPGVDRNKNVISPKVNQTSSLNYRKVTTLDTLLDLIRNMFPPNIVQACIEQYQTVLTASPGQQNSSKYRISNQKREGCPSFRPSKVFTR